ncbi:outer dynein arm-docking complex subunit 4 [Poeciliopsis prolifica]|uniref:outer dynein arm-docking complex subunit 4 n=1 Tax=Poeciliopsis prolifica TaxID=188132 RepID=UPI0024138FE7|nr:outer dynein arm-docking complex subunit 4 [Poeciliopsis prolifica]
MATKKRHYTEEEILKGKTSALRADGEWKYRKRNYKQALNSFSAAIELNPKEKRSFVSRSKCYIQLGQLRNALIDAEASLAEDPFFPEGVYQKAEALYYIGEFEFALVFYRRGLKLRPQTVGWRLGINKTEEAIVGSIGSRSFIKPEVMGDLSYLEEEVVRKQPIAVVQNLTKKDRSPTSMKNERTTRQLLGGFYQHKGFLEKLLKDEDLIKGVTKNGERVEDLIKNCITSLNHCADFWSQEKPISHKDFSLQSKAPKPSLTTRKALYLRKAFDEISRSLATGSTKSALAKIEDVIKTVQGLLDNECPIKDELMCFLHSCMGQAFFDLGDLDRAMEYHEDDLYLARHCDIPEAISRALANIGCIYAETKHFEKAIEFWKERIPYVHEGLENTWMLHEIGCCYLELNQPETAIDYGLRSIAVAEEMFDDTWRLRATALVGQCELELGNLESSVSFFEKALSIAEFENDGMALKTIQKVLSGVKEQLQNQQLSSQNEENGEESEEQKEEQQEEKKMVEDASEKPETVKE